jgi:hypothetical protein
MLPTAIRSKYNNAWRPIFELMETAPGLHDLRDSRATDYVQEKLQVAEAYLKNQRMGYCWVTPAFHPGSWRVSQWSKMCRRSSIMRHGTDEDKNNLPPPRSHRNGARIQRGRIRPLVDLRRRVQRRRVVVPPGVAPEVREEGVQEEEEEEKNDGAQEEEKDEEVLDPFARAFANVEMTPTMAARAREIEEAELLLQVADGNHNNQLT